MLAAVGTPEVSIYDDDIVAIENLGPQAYFQQDINIPKVVATKELMRLVNPDITCTAKQDRFKRSTEFKVKDGRQLCVFCCVDDIEVRKLLWERLKDQIDFWVDGRMSAEIYEVLSVNTPREEKALAKIKTENLFTTFREIKYKPYEDTFFAKNEAFPVSCTAKSTVFTANICAGNMIQPWSMYLRGVSTEDELDAIESHKVLMKAAKAE
jgi:hypothetical protein